MSEERRAILCQDDDICTNWAFDYHHEKLPVPCQGPKYVYECREDEIAHWVIRPDMYTTLVGIFVCRPVEKLRDEWLWEIVP